MAKWGEGDPRWIVEERPDAKNVNNWHWTEKNATPWSKERLQSLFSGFTIQDDAKEYTCKIKQIDKIEGEATANNRKGKLILFYEWNIILKWSGSKKNQKTPTKGKITIPNLSEENPINEVEITVTIDESNNDSEIIKSFMYEIGREKLREVLKIYLKELGEESAKGLFLPKKGEETMSPIDNVIKVSKSGFNKNEFNNSSISKKNAENEKGNVDVKQIVMNEKFQCRPKDLFDAFTNEKMMCAFTRDAAKCNAVEGGEFLLFGGNITGVFHELIPYNKIVQSWRYKPWPEGHYSYVVMDFIENDDHTELKITQNGVPACETNVTINNWKGYYFNSMRQTFGFGSFLV